MLNQFARTELLIGTEGTRRLAAARVAIFGVGGVGGFVAEALARSGIGTLDLIDHDSVSVTNLNRQIFALHSTLGKYKVDVAKERILDIIPKAQVNAYKVFYMPDTAGQFDFARYDYIVDAIDTVTGKIALIEQAQAAGTPVISSMGAGNKMNPAMFQAADLYETSVCPLARVMRRELKKRGINSLKVVYSREPALTPLVNGAVNDCENKDPDASTGGHVKKRQIPGSNAFVPSAVGLIMAGEVVKDLIEFRKEN